MFTNNWLRASAALVAWAATTLAIRVPANPVARAELYGNCPSDQVSDVQRFAKGLSGCAEIYFPGSAQFDKVLSRWSVYKAPHANMVVVPCTEDDVVKSVRYANKKNTPFLAVNAGHGTITSLGKMESGIQIYLTKLSSVKVSKDGKYAIIGGGTRSKDVTDGLWAAGKQTVTGVCECVSYLGPALGGGHGWLQGHHGLVSDQILSFNVVLADGTLKKVESKDDLYWGLKGAGHNFGIVTSVTSKVYDIEYPSWAIATLIFKSDKLVAVYEAANARLINGNQAVGVINWSFWRNDETIDPENPVIIFHIMQEGVTAVEQIWLEPFLKLGPAASKYNSGSYRDLATWTVMSETDAICQHTGQSHPRFPLYLKSYNSTAQKEAFALFAKNTRKDSPFYLSLCIFEGYSMDGVQALPLGESAFPFRNNEILTVIAFIYTSKGDEMDQRAVKFGEDWRKILHKGSGIQTRRVYVNYAFGDESLKELYGVEQWRQKRLRTLKAKYDPKGKYDFYGPIP